MKKEENKIYLPEGWSLSSIGDLIGAEGLFVDGDWIESKDQDPNGNVRLIQLADIGEADFKDRSNRYMTFDRAQELGCTFLKQDDILVARMPEPLGRATLFPLAKADGYVTVVDVAIIRPGNGINNKYLSYIINSPGVRKRIYELQTGTTRKRISRRNLATVKIPIAPLPEQLRIVDKIEELFSEIKKCKDQLTVNIKQLAFYKQSLFTWIFEGKGTKDQKKAVKKWTSLGEIAEIAGGVTIGRNLAGKKTIRVPYLRVANVQDGYLDLKDVKTIEIQRPEKEKYKLIFGDILYTEGGDRDKLGRGTIWRDEIKNCIHQNHIFRARLVSKSIDPKYIAYYSQTKTAKDYFFKYGKQTTNLASINIKTLSGLPIPLYPIDIQQEIVQEIEAKLSVCNKAEETILETEQQIEQLRISILRNAAMGKLSDQNVGEEPAFELLNRIVEERKAYLQQQNQVTNQAPKMKRKIEKELTILQVLAGSKTPMSAKAVWQQSKYRSDIEMFYAELKKVSPKISEVKKGMLTLKK